jgi:hypothetical protein
VFQKGEASLGARLSNHALAREVLRFLKQLDTTFTDRKCVANQVNNLAKARQLTHTVRDIVDAKREGYQVRVLGTFGTR